MLEHEYALLGAMNRTKIGRYLSLASATISGVTVFSLRTAVDLAKEYGLPVNALPTLLSLLGTFILETSVDRLSRLDSPHGHWFWCLRCDSPVG